MSQFAFLREWCDLFHLAARAERLVKRRPTRVVADGRQMSANQLESIDVMANDLTEPGIMPPERSYELPFTDLARQGPGWFFRQAHVTELARAEDVEWWIKAGEQPLSNGEPDLFNHRPLANRIVQIACIEGRATALLGRFAPRRSRKVSGDDDSSPGEFSR